MQGTEQLSPQKISELIGSHCAAIEQIGAQLSEATNSLRTDRETDPELSLLLDKHHFSVTQQRQLTRLAQRLAARAPRERLLNEELTRSGSSREVLRELERRLDALPIFPNLE